MAADLDPELTSQADKGGRQAHHAYLETDEQGLIGHNSRSFI